MTSPPARGRRARSHSGAALPAAATILRDLPSSVHASLGGREPERPPEVLGVDAMITGGALRQ